MPEPADKAMPVVEAIMGRKAIRRFKPDPVPQETVTRILDIAARSPSGTNSQPWLVHVVTGAARQRVIDTVLAAAKDGTGEREYHYSPEPWFEPYLGRKRKVGFELYGHLGIERSDMAGRTRQHHKNYDFFGAPVGMFVTMDRRQELGPWIDIGMFMQSIMLAARAFGLETCPQAAWVFFGKQVHAAVPIPDEEILICGLALGYADWEARDNAFTTVREQAAQFTRFHTD